MSVVAIYKTFTHKEPERVTTIRLPRGAEAPAQVAQLAKAVQIEGRTAPGGFGVILFFAGPARARLLATENGRLLVHHKGGFLRSLAAVEAVEYLSDKDGDGEVLYRHVFEEPQPALMVVPNSKGKLARFVGGRYTIEEHGIVG